jgi:hypothetical protein
MRKLITSLMTFAFVGAIGVALMSSPTTAISHPGNTCNPPAGHGRSGCHRVTTSTAPTAAQNQAVRARALAKARVAAHKRAVAQAEAAARKAAARRHAIAKKHAAAKRAAAAKAAADAAAAAQAAQAATPASVPATPTDVAAASPRTAEHAPWWVELWRLISGQA